MEIWGRCGACSRWFYCPLSAPDHWACPACAAEPVAIVNRAVGSRIIADRPAVPAPQAAAAAG